MNVDDTVVVGASVVDVGGCVVEDVASVVDVGGCVVDDVASVVVVVGFTVVVVVASVVVVTQHSHDSMFATGVPPSGHNSPLKSHAPRIRAPAARAIAASV